jgi:2-polyprenyl-6-methoxyphenol hydroxylase-like FAD-dependent oxidoreductase
LELEDMEIAILGGGVAGVSSAIALKQRGFDVRIYERHESVSHIGAGIVVWPNAAFVLEQLDVLNEVKSVSGSPVSMRRLSNTGEDLGAIDIASINGRMGYPSLSVLRRDFQNILVSKLESLGVTIQYAHTITNIETTNSDKAEVHFENGLKIGADVLIGADGRMASCARRYVHGNNAPVYQGFINWIGVCESEEDVFQEQEIADYWGVGQRFGIVPITKRKAYWAGGVASTDIGLKNSEEYGHELASIFSGWPSQVRDTIERTPAEYINKIYVHDHNPIRTWHRNNLVVVGDAAHAPLPTSGQGACQALEDAWHLTNCLQKNPNDVSRAFVEFTGLRFEKTENIITAARGLASSLFNRDEHFCKTRNEASKTTNFAGLAAAMSKGWGQYLPLNA